MDPIDDKGAALTIAAVLVRHAAPNRWNADNWERKTDGVSFTVDYGGFKGTITVVLADTHPYYSVIFPDTTLPKIHIEALYTAIDTELRHRIGLA